MAQVKESELQIFLSGAIPKDILDDLSSRFIINVPVEERKDVIRICFQIELAHWFYLDFYCAENSFLKPCGMKDFTKIIFNHVPSLKQHAEHTNDILKQWREYKMAVPTYGAIMMDSTMENVLLVQSYFAKSSWSFPKGKVNEQEEPHHCAVREVLEETGFDISKLINEQEFIQHTLREQQIRLYIIVGVPKDFNFAPKTRNEIKGFKWFSVWGLPSHKKDLDCKPNTGFNSNAFFMVMPFVKGIHKWVAAHQAKPTGLVGGKSTRRQRSKTIGDISSVVQVDLVSLSDVSDGVKRSGSTGEQASTTTTKGNYCDDGRSNKLVGLVKQTEYLTSIKIGPLKGVKSSKDKVKEKRAEEKGPIGNKGGSTKTGPLFSSPTWLHFRFDRKKIMKGL